jgi:glycosyltransferase involved in cell wall biosynthesis
MEKLTNKPRVSVLIPTYRRALLLSYVLSGLKNQIYKDFEVLIILKPSGDNTEQIVKNYKRWLNIKLIIQKKGYFTDALNLGLENAEGDLIAFLDDDAIPDISWLQNHVKTYTKFSVGGVAGNVIPAILKRNESIPLKDKASEIVPDYKNFLETIGRKIWNKPLEGLEDYLVYLSKAGTVAYNSSISQVAWHQTVKSLLGMGANMSVLSKAVEDFRFPNSWILGLTNEQFLGWHIWKKGYNIIFNPNAKVYHIIHGQTLTRNVKESKKDSLRIIEHNLLFYRLYGLEQGLSWMHRIAWLFFSNLVNIKKICIDKEINRIMGIKSMLFSELIGMKWLISRTIGGRYSPLTDLRRIIDLK